MKQLNHRSPFSLEKLIVVWLIQWLLFYGTRNTLPCSQELAIGPLPAPDRCSFYLITTLIPIIMLVCHLLLDLLVVSSPQAFRLKISTLTCVLHAQTISSCVGRPRIISDGVISWTFMSPKLVLFSFLCKFLWFIIVLMKLLEREAVKEIMWKGFSCSVSKLP